MNSNQRIQQHFEEAAQLLERVRHDAALIQAIDQSGQTLIDTLANGGKIISCGNGGSMSDAMHFAEELSGRYREDRPGLAAIACSDPSHLTCVGNDYGFDQVFARYVQALGKKGDALVAISTSGNSANVLNAARVAREMGMSVVGLTGRGGGELTALCDVQVSIPWEGYADRVQELHIKVIHAWIDQIERAQ
ncbi:MAG TPA: phosphoheptose isomerase [Flavobacteriales bacterium]|jgi:D-sedoheptulose 7-phosphate isomerase|nr:D-sedoheptulose 7-phosphate isomerase [Flavobacteriales bacterium]MDO7740310.1 D-sedoheptulose 7-phosphate isomerase [Flavobacteriales bacterium]HAW73437.1 phosphoheptose isomerase [Flavobacteriales bacterium]|tara:strand:+ start:3428 stop:4003 length:576 start_codon:yes stop_codon:yes gene_type:complete